MLTTNRVGKSIVLYAAFVKFSAKNRIFIATPAFHQDNGVFGIDALAGPGCSNDLARRQRLESLQGRPVLVNFWATWCPPCIAELPALDNAAKQLGDDVTLLLISVDRGGRQKALPFLQDRGITRPLMGFDPKAALSREMGVRGLPTSFLLNADQSQGWAYVGPREWDSTLMIAEIRNLLRLAKASPAPPRQNNQDHLLV